MSVPRSTPYELVLLYIDDLIHITKLALWHITVIAACYMCVTSPMAALFAVISNTDIQQAEAAVLMLHAALVAMCLMATGTVPWSTPGVKGVARLFVVWLVCFVQILAYALSAAALHAIGTAVYNYWDVLAAAPAVLYSTVAAALEPREPLPPGPIVEPCVLRMSVYIDDRWISIPHPKCNHGNFHVVG